MTLRDRPAPADATSSLGALVRRHQGAVWRHLRWLGADPGQADDLAQEVFLVLLRQPFEERSEGETRAFLRATAMHLWRDHLRRLGRAVDQVSLDAATAAATRHEENRSERLDALLGCVARLEGRSREALLWHYEEGLDRATIAERLAMKPGGVKTLLQRVRAALRDCVQRTMEVAR